MRIRIEGSNLPGRNCAADGTFPGYDNIHVGIQRRNQPNDVVDLYAGDSPAAVWTFDAAVVAAPFRPDIRGPFIQGAPGQRFIYLSWGTVDSESTFVMFRRAKLVLADIGAEIFVAAEESGELTARLGLRMRKAIPCVPESSRRPWNGPPGSRDRLVGGRPPSQWRAQCALMMRLVSESDELEVWRQRARESILDLNDGIVTAAGIAEGFASAGATTSTLLVAGVATVIAGGFTAASARYTEITTEWEMNRALIEEERASIQTNPEEEFEELVGIYQGKGLGAELARQVASALTEHDPLAAHADAEYGLDELGPTSGAAPAAAVAGLSYGVGAGLPLIAIRWLPHDQRIILTFAVVLFALALTGWFASWLTRLPALKMVRRNLILGAATMAASLLIGLVIHV